MIAAFPLVGVTLRGLVGRRRTVLMIALAALPVVVGLLIRLGGGRLEAEAVLDALVVRTVLPIVALVLGTGALGSALEDGTAVYLLAKPVARHRIAGAAVAVAAALTLALVVPATVATGLLGGGASTDGAAVTAAFAVAVALGGIAYAAAFVALTTLTSRALVLGLGYVLVWEGVLADLLEGTRFLSVRQATLGIAEGLSGGAGGATPLDPVASVVLLAAVVAGAVAIGSWRLGRFELRGGD